MHLIFLIVVGLAVFELAFFLIGGLFGALAEMTSSNKREERK